MKFRAPEAMTAILSMKDADIAKDVEHAAMATTEAILRDSSLIPSCRIAPISPMENLMFPRARYVLGHSLPNGAKWHSSEHGSLTDALKAKYSGYRISRLSLEGGFLEW